MIVTLANTVESQKKETLSYSIMACQMFLCRAVPKLPGAGYIWLSAPWCFHLGKNFPGPVQSGECRPWGRDFRRTWTQTVSLKFLILTKELPFLMYFTAACSCTNGCSQLLLGLCQLNKCQWKENKTLLFLQYLFQETGPQNPLTDLYKFRILWVCIWESQDRLGWKRLLTSSSPTLDSSPQCQMDQSTKFYVISWTLPGIVTLPACGKSITMFKYPLHEKIIPVVQSEVPLGHLEAVFCHLLPGSRGHPPPGCTLFSRSCREWYGHP